MALEYALVRFVGNDMEGQIQERDWKYLRMIHDELIDELCSRILSKSVTLAAEGKERPHQRYLKLYRYIQESDDLVAECFNDWRRSTISNRILSLRQHRLLADEHVKNLSEKAQEWLRMVEENF
jgi:hypothetical protein